MAASGRGHSKGRQRRKGAQNLEEVTVRRIREARFMGSSDYLENDRPFKGFMTKAPCSLW